MPGPGGSHGGGSRGGGGFGGGGGPRGGGFGGPGRGPGGPGGFGGPGRGPGGPGGFGGPGRGPGGFGGPGGFHHRPPRRGGYWGRPYGYGYGGGCLGWVMSALMLPVIIILIAAVLLFSSFSTAINTVSTGGNIVYDEESLQDYANNQYAAEFGGSAAYEDYVLLVFLIDENHYDYSYIAWVGDHVATPVNKKFDSQGELGLAISSSVNASSYKYSLDADLAKVVGQLESSITSLGLTSSYTCSENHAGIPSHLTNRSELQLTADTVNIALESFTEATDIPIVIVVDEMEDVFGRTVSSGAIFSIIIAVALIALAVWLIVRTVRNRRNGDQNDGNDDNSSRYRNEDRRW